MSGTVHHAQPVAGYTIAERIGSGGYGEVWKAVAPGGLSKAIKFVYGCLDDNRAACELKALQRIKEVRHPFLLSLERIEVVDGQLVIVTELADASLKDRFTACRAAGAPGIPREELLVYLGDAADALDYMSERYSLQHLDVKPENLLIVGGRVKVADFGLVKEIEDHTISLVGGLTPSYAAPESFDSRPSRHSDQYSLAIVYQEMLTGVLPFPGKTTAQLMSQHLYSKPRCAPLPLGERAAIARALAKEPGERFPNCREMIAALLAAGRGLQAAVPSEAPTEVRQRVDTDSAGSGSAGTATEMELAPSGHSSWGGDDPPTLHTLAWDDVALAAGKSAPRPRPSIPSEPQAGPAVVVALPPIEAAPKEPRLRPTLFLGIGGTATRVLSRLHRKICDRAGSLASLPAVEMVLWDTDLDALSEAASGRGAGSLEVRQTLALPLRRPQEYRENSEKLLRWLSRRWLYNIPRSLRTEGIRPLGRLAMVDHSQEVLARLDVALRSIASPERADDLGRRPGDGVRRGVPTGLPRCLDFRRDGERHGARCGVCRTAGAPRTGPARRCRLRHPSPFHGTRSKRKGSGNCQCLRLPSGAAPLRALGQFPRRPSHGVAGDAVRFGAVCAIVSCPSG